jgi:hypothetical protein
MSVSDDPGFKDALEEFCEEWDISYALLLLPSKQGNVGLMGVNLNREQIIKLLKVMNDHSAELPKKRLDS